MKKNIIALAVASAISAPVAMADAPVVFGQLNLNINATTNADATVNSTASRLGFKGSEDLGDGLKAVYHIEFGLDSITDQENTSGNTGITGGTVMSQRNAFLGLAGGFGTVLMGRHDTPLKMSQPSDLFNDGAADLGNNNMTAGVAVSEDRADDVLAYVSPSFSGVKLIAAVVMGEGKTSAATAVYDDSTSVAITYGSTKKGLYLAAGNTSKKQASNTLSVNRFSAQYKTGGLIVNGMYSDATNSSATNGTKAITFSGVAVAANAAYDNSGTVTAIQAAYKIGKFMPKIKVSMTDPKLAGTDKTTNTSIGLNYSLGKKTTAYIYAVDADKKNTIGKDATIVGLLHKF